MSMSFYRLILSAAALGLGIAAADTLDNRSLTGKYWVRHVLIAGGGGAITESRSFLGSFTFDGTGGFTYQGQQVLGAGGASPFTGSGTYSVKPGGGITLSNPLRAGAEVRGGLGVGAIVGSSTEVGGIYDLLIAIPAATASVSNSTISGSYSVSTLEFPLGTTTQVRNSFFRADANGSGAFGAISINGHAVNLNNRPLTQAIGLSTYSVAPDGSGTVTFPLGAGLSSATQLVSGTKSIYVSGDGMLFVGGSTEAGSHDFVVGMKALTGANLSSWKDQFFAAGLRWEAGNGGSFQGSAKSNGTGKVVWSRRVRAPEGVIDFTGGSNYTLISDGSGSTETNRILVGAGGLAFAGNGVALTDSNNYELYFGVRTPTMSGSGVFVNPHGILNAASFAPVGSPIAPGEFITLFGTGIAPRTEVAQGTTWPTTLAGVQVLINNTPAPVYAVVKSDFEQISVLVPFGSTGTTAKIVVVANGTRSNEVEVPLARSAPGVFSMPQTGTGAGAILHPDFSLVSSTKPVRRGGTVLIYLTGLGTVTPTIPDGTTAPISPLSVIPATVPMNVYVGGKRATVDFKGLAPTLTGLYQLNVRIPGDAPTGSAIALAIETPDAFHDQVDIAVAP